MYTPAPLRTGREYSLGRMNTTTIYIAEDHPLFRKAVRDLLSADPQLRIAGESGDGSRVMAALRELRPEVLILDLNLPGATGLDLMRDINKEGLPVRVIALTMRDEENVFNEVMDAGAFGYVLKESSVDVILEAIRSVVGGEHYISPTLSHYLIERRRKSNNLKEQNPDLDLLTSTERKILHLIAREKTSQKIADELFISEKTVENHRMNICNKLHLHGSNSLLKFAIQNKSSL
jgi:two-component system response regulator DegU